MCMCRSIARAILTVHGARTQSGLRVWRSTFCSVCRFHEARQLRNADPVAGHWHARARTGRGLCALRAGCVAARKRHLPRALQRPHFGRHRAVRESVRVELGLIDTAIADPQPITPVHLKKLKDNHRHAMTALRLVEKEMAGSAMRKSRAARWSSFRWKSASSIPLCLQPSWRPRRDRGSCALTGWFMRLIRPAAQSET